MNPSKEMVKLAVKAAEGMVSLPGESFHKRCVAILTGVGTAHVRVDRISSDRQ